MAIHNQEAVDYFRSTKVHYALCPRNPDPGKSTVQGAEISTPFAHHQKTVVVDSEVPGGRELRKWRIVSFVGGIDLCNGRYDMPYHSLFRTLNNLHHDDFHQPCFNSSSIEKGGPREPWHDIHCRLEGPIAWDVMTNFEQRWRRQVGGDKLIPLSELNEIITEPMPVMPSDDPEAWNIQLFRSIDEKAAFGLHENAQQPATLGLVSCNNNTVDRSIQDAYIHAIRRARRFIYIETQHFLGSSFSWKSEDGLRVEDVGALNLIPKEISLKIVSKIEAREEFVVYIVIPMWSEGLPESDFVQAILDWQKRTMEMMYSDIAAILQAKGVNRDPNDYLLFLCLGKKEKRMDGEYVPAETPETDTDYGRAQQARRFMIYVHANTMIVDDEYIIVGSANINQRSMDGARDSEIAIGAYQPHHLATDKLAEGQIHGFRMALWLEHFGLLIRAFRFPWGPDCICWVKQYADFSLKLYTSNGALDTDRNTCMLQYPIGITKEGKIESLQGLEFFPDTRARVLGATCDALSPILTT